MTVKERDKSVRITFIKITSFEEFYHNLRYKRNLDLFPKKNFFKIHNIRNKEQWILQFFLNKIFSSLCKQMN
jgi:hypothetical protein